MSTAQLVDDSVRSSSAGSRGPNAKQGNCDFILYARGTTERTGGRWRQASARLLERE
jgi:hypothetical protein